MVYLGVVSGALAVFTLLTRHDEGSSASALFWTGVLATVLACGPVLRARGAVVTVTLPAGGAEALESFVDTLRGAPAGGEAVELRVLLPGLALQRLADSLGIPISFHPFGAVASLMVAVLAGMGVARISARWATAVLPGRHDPMVSAAGWNAGKIALIGAACMALVLADFAMAPLVGGLTVVEEQPLDRWLAAQDGPVMVIEYPLERNGGVARYHGRYHGGTSAYDALVTRGLSTHEEAQLEAFPHPESVAFLQRQGVTHLVVASEAYARVTGRSWAEARGALDVAPGVQLAGVVREEDSWRDESLTDAIDVGSWLVAGPRDTLYVYTLQR